MLKRDRNTMESYRHICDGKSVPVIMSKPAITLHDVQAAILIDGNLIPITFCPYCGCRVDEEERT